MDGVPLMRLRRFLRANLRLGDRLSEIFYGVWMVTVSVGIASSVLTGETTIEAVLLIALIVNLTWGLIDGITYVLGGEVNRAEEDRKVMELRSGGMPHQREEMMGFLGDTILRNLTEEERWKVVDMLQGSAKPVEGWKVTPGEAAACVAIITIDFLAMLPVVLPFLVLPDLATALFTSHVIAAISFMLVGYAWSIPAGWKRWKAVAVFGLMGTAVIAFSCITGW